MNDSSSIAIFKSDDGKISVNVNFDLDTAWLSLDQIAELLDGVEVKWKPLGEVAENLNSMRKPSISKMRQTLLPVTRI